ncbi:TPA: hypothetical protein ACPVYZ_004330 [Vibrio parahaemolyticus]|uniref:hypothetical protein n=1 Tax=Vibrio parahaemolyticus TaxID=670 RepID=UPI001120DF83|nr:hypothetical protein [Vibrio parahaemolyticus]MBE4286486.1 hypothetical protein [Vibrio parahaemolyticus]TOH19122.1 hypothetical protein CGI90_03855 [Vibrio parahaemolyticus]HCG7330529.1 hypothetical protein [Vibrio parahaemolyticus]HCG9589108.1 hypothetical protein [Vibrio parahaemolyticus]HCH1183542.1 hypothetical protein [Vibrio parahaemolyticus]
MSIHKGVNTKLKSQAHHIFNSDIARVVPDHVDPKMVAFALRRRKNIPKKKRLADLDEFYSKYKPFIVSDADSLPETDLTEPVVMPYMRMALEVPNSNYNSQGRSRDVFIFDVEDGALVCTGYNVMENLSSKKPWVTMDAAKVIFDRSTSDLSSYRTELFPLRVDLNAELEGFKKHVDERALKAARYLHSLCVALRASNVTVIDASSSKRKCGSGSAKPKSYANDVRIINVSRNDDVVRYLQGEGAKGTGTSKRAHTRRSHIRRLASGKEIIIPECFVGAGNAIKQEYHL